MREAMHGSGVSDIAPHTNARGPRKRIIRNCSICMCRVPHGAISVMEPEGAPEPRISWVLCQECYRALLNEMRRSPVRSPLRLRIAIGLVAAERHPRSVSPVRKYVHDHFVVVFIAWVFVAAMLLHLALIVMIAYIAK